MMNWILLVMAGIAAAVIAIVVGGLVTPSRYTVRRSITLRTDPARVRQALHDALSWPIWTERAISVSMAGAPEQTSGAEPAEITGTVALRVTDDDTRVIGSFAFVVRPDGSGSRVDCTEQGHIGDPLRRFLRTHVTGLAGHTDAALRTLAEQLGEFDRQPVAQDEPR